MKMQEIIDEIKLELTGYTTELEIDDTVLKSIVNKSLRELERYWDESKFVTVPFRTCIDLKGFDHASIVKVYRATGYGSADESDGKMVDPVYAQQWMVFSNLGTMYNLQDYVLNYASWCTMSQIRNTMSTDLAFREDKHDCKLYINANSAPTNITIEYIPKLTDPDEIKDEFWIDILIRLATAYTKVALGRIRTKYVLNNMPYTIDGDKILEEGNSELKELRETLRTNSNLIFPID